MTALRLCEFQMTSESARRSEALGAALGRLLAPGDVICLAGELGAGKTVFARGIGAGWCATPPVTSPTYNLVHEHERSSDCARLYHLDFYRISGAREAETLGLEEMFDGGAVVLFEWPERVEAILPAERLWIDIVAHEYQARELTFLARGERYAALLGDFRRALGASG